MVKKLLIATKNKGKAYEFFAILKDLNFQIITLADIDPFKTEPKETGKTFAENAIVKARFYGQKTGFLTLTDDSGLLVEALPDKLGIKTRRYSKGSSKTKYLKLLKEMEKISHDKRGAKFISAIAFFDPEKNYLKITAGVCRGKISNQPKGKYGFGYDPVFIVKDLNKHFSELSLEEKNQVSHRAKALKKMKKYLKTNYEI